MSKDWKESKSVSEAKEVLTPEEKMVIEKGVRLLATENNNLPTTTHKEYENPIIDRVIQKLSRL